MSQHDEYDEDGVANWMIEFEKQQRVKQRIACEELGYPASEARFSTVEDWEKYHGQRWDDYISEIA